MGSPITMEKARKALKKLQAEDITTPQDAHPTFAICDDEGTLIATTGLRRSSTKDITVGHVPKDLLVSQQIVLGLANCPISREQYLTKVGGSVKEKADTKKSNKTDEESEPQAEPEDDK